MAITTQARNDLITLVVGMFDGAPGAQVLSDLTNAFEAGQSLKAIATNLAKSAEYQSIYPDLLTNAEFAAQLVDNIVGNLVPASQKAEAAAMLLGQLNAQPTTTSAQKAAARADVTITAINALKAIPTTDAVWGNAAAALANKVEVATYHSVTLAQPSTNLTDLQDVLANVDHTAASVENAKGNIQPNPGEVYFLTTGPDTITGGAGDDVFNARPIDSTGEVSTLTGFDTIDGGNGNDTLNIYTANVAGGENLTLPSTTTIKNIETINVYNDGATFSTTGGDIDASRFVGAQQIWQRGDSSTDVIDLAATVTAGFGGHQVGADVNALKDAASINLALEAVTAGSWIQTFGSNTVNVKGSLATGGDFTLVANAASATSKTITVNSGVAAEVFLNGAGVTTLDAAASTGALTYEVAGTRVNATTGSGDDEVTITATTKVAVATGAGKDTVILDSALATGSTINLGAGNDVLTATGAGSFGAGVIVDGGEGTDAISASLINAGNAANIKNFELLDLTAGFGTALDLDLLTGSTIEKLVLQGTNGAAAVNNVAAGLGLTVSGLNAAATTIGVKGATTGTADAFTVTFEGSSAASANVVLNGIEAVSVVSGGTGANTNTITLTGNAAKTLTLSGAKDVVVDFAVAGFGTAGSNGVSAIDAGAATGDVTINTTNVGVATAGLTVTTGAGDDTITLAGKATVVAGAGDDTIISSAAGGTFTGGAGKDTFDVSLAAATGVTEATSIFVTITDLQADDAIDFGVGTSFNATAIVLGVGVNNLEQALAAAVTTANQVSWFQYGSNTYIVADQGSGTFGAGDVVVKLTGLVDLSDATLAANVLTA